MEQLKTEKEIKGESFNKIEFEKLCKEKWTNISDEDR